MKLKQILLFAVSMALLSVPISAIQESGSPRNLIGAWRLSARESGGSPIQNPRGLLVLDRVGNLLVISTRAGRSAYATSQPTPGEARAALDSYDGFFGKYNVTNAKDLAVSIEGGLNPGRIGKSTKWPLEHQADRLIVSTPEWGRMTWAYLPELEDPSPLQQQSSDSGSL